jgi:hypothetical protein
VRRQSEFNPKFPATDEKAADGWVSFQRLPQWVLILLTKLINNDGGPARRRTAEKQAARRLVESSSIGRLLAEKHSAWYRFCRNLFQAKSTFYYACY